MKFNLDKYYFLIFPNFKLQKLQIKKKYVIELKFFYKSFLIRNYRKILIFKPEYTIHNNNFILKDIKSF